MIEAKYLMKIQKKEKAGWVGNSDKSMFYWLK